ncbi:MAG: helix-turn-helix domain-containing protein [Chloroflexi bacterium]|nr:helix-turn-helix domain-containing protein [Chloroflexota bacterium]
MSTISAQELADRLGISIFTVRRYVRTGRLVAQQDQDDLRIRREDLAGFLESREIPVFPPTGAAPTRGLPARHAGPSEPDPTSSSARTRSDS